MCVFQLIYVFTHVLQCICVLQCSKNDIGKFLHENMYMHTDACMYCTDICVYMIHQHTHLEEVPMVPT